MTAIAPISFRAAESNQLAGSCLDTGAVVVVGASNTAAYLPAHAAGQLCNLELNPMGSMPAQHAVRAESAARTAGGHSFRFSAFGRTNTKGRSSARHARAYARQPEASLHQPNPYFGHRMFPGLAISQTRNA